MPIQTAAAGTMKQRIATHGRRRTWRTSGGGTFAGVSTAARFAIVRAAGVLGYGQPYPATSSGGPDRPKKRCISAHFRHTSPSGALVGYEHMFAALERTADRQRERRREARRCELRSLFEQEARIKQRVTQIVREAEDDEDWQAAGCSTSAQWLAQIAGSDYRSAARITRASSALGSLPALDRALSAGAAESRSGRSRCRVRDARDRCRAGARRARQAAQRHIACRAHARPAQAGGRPGAVSSGVR